MYFEKVRIPVAKPGHSIKSKKDYDRRSNKEAIEAEVEECCRLFSEYACKDCGACKWVEYE